MCQAKRRCYTEAILSQCEKGAFYEVDAKSGRPPALQPRPGFDRQSCAPQYGSADPSDRRISLLQEIEETIRGCGFHGDHATIAEFENTPGAVIHGSNLRMLHEAMPHLTLFTYDSIYDRRLNRESTVEMCIRQPKELGFPVHFLSRGVMPHFDRPETFGPLEAQWQMTIDDARSARPDGLWFMGVDARTRGMVCDLQRLQAFGFESGREARLKLMAMLRSAGLLGGRNRS